MLHKFLTLIRSAVFFLGQVIATLFFASIGLMLFAFPYTVRYKFITLWSHFVILWAKWCCGITYEVIGRENIPANNAIVLCKHQSAWETFFLQTILPPQTWVLKKELLAIPFFGWALSLLEPIAIDRKKANSIKQLLEQGKQRLNQKRWVIIFPEGSRMPVGKTGKYSRSGVTLAKASGYDILPIAHNAGVFWPRHSFIKRPGKISVVIGEPISVGALDESVIQNQVKDWIEHQSQNLLEETKNS